MFVWSLGVLWPTCRFVRSAGPPLGSYHAPFIGSHVLGSGYYKHKVGYPRKGYGMSLEVGRTTVLPSDWVDL